MTVNELLISNCNMGLKQSIKLNIWNGEKKDVDYIDATIEDLFNINKFLKVKDKVDAHINYDISTCKIMEARVLYFKENRKSKKTLDALGLKRWTITIVLQ